MPRNDAAPRAWLPSLREINAAPQACSTSGRTTRLSSTAYASLRLCLPPPGRRTS